MMTEKFDFISARNAQERREKMAPILDRIPKIWGKYLPEVGWDNHLLKLDEMLSQLDPDYQILQAKQKFGGLRFYTENSAAFKESEDFEETSQEFDRLVELAEQESYTICEYCSEPGKIRNGGWISVLCDKHA
jgi:hypothetical protein